MGRFRREESDRGLGGTNGMKRGLTQNYLLCILGKKGKVSAFGIEKYIGLTAAGVLELLPDGGKEAIGDFSLEIRRCNNFLWEVMAPGRMKCV